MVQDFFVRERVNHHLFNLLDTVQTNADSKADTE